MTRGGVPAAPVPDAKDWTWVLSQPCAECGFDPLAIGTGTVADRARHHADTLRAALRRPDAADRPAATVWSPLEYACHVRDVCTLFDGRLALMLAEDDPVFENWDQDATALEQRYWEQDPDVVDRELGSAVAAVGARFETVDGDRWDRPSRRSNGSRFTVRSFALYFLHDLAHHAWDVTSGGRAILEP